MKSERPPRGKQISQKASTSATGPDPTEEDLAAVIVALTGIDIASNGGNAGPERSRKQSWRR
jgi:hypothetical protein